MTPDWVQAVASILTLVAAIVAAIIAAKAPRLAARFAEDYRKEGAREDERARIRSQVFLMLLRGRRQLAAKETIEALNVVDFAFHDDPAVRSAYRVFIEATMRGGADLIVQKYQVLTLAVAKALGYADSITEADMALGYYPEILGKLDAAALVEAERKLAHIEGAGDRTT